MTRFLPETEIKNIHYLIVTAENFIFPCKPNLYPIFSIYSNIFLYNQKVKCEPNDKLHNEKLNIHSYVGKNIDEHMQKRPLLQITTHERH